MKKLLMCVLASACISAFAGFAKYVTITVSGYSGASLSDFQLLVHIDGTKLPGVYTDVVNAGADLKFTDSTGLTEYPYEVDVWNPDGESLVWVKIPSLHAGECTLRMYYGNADKTTNTTSTDVWTGYHGVWHLNSDFKDSTANGYHGVETNTVGATTGAVGTGWTISNSTTAGDREGAIWMPTSTSLQHGTSFSWAGWIKTTVTGNGGQEYMPAIARRPLNCWKGGSSAGGFIYMWNGDWSGYGFAFGIGSGKGTINCYTNAKKLNDGVWRYVVITDEDGKLTSYIDGTKVADGKWGPSAFCDNGYPLVIGNESSTDMTKIGTTELPSDSSNNPGCMWQSHGSAWKGSVDEYRLHSGVLTADRIAADYLTQSSDLTTFGTPVELGAESVTFYADVVSGAIPFDSTFTAVPDGLSGSMTFEWDFDNDGVTDSVTSVPTVTHTWTARGVYSVKVTVTDGSGKSATATIADYITVQGTIYVDSEAAAGGNGSLAHPFTTLQEAVAEVSADETILVRGGSDRLYTFATSADSLHFVFEKSGVEMRGCDVDWTPITNWTQTNDMPCVTIAPDYAYESFTAAGANYDAPIMVNAADFTISGFKFEFGYWSFKRQNYGGTGLIDVDADNTVVEACAFIMTDKNGGYASVGTSGIIYGVSDLATNCKIRKNYVWLGKYRDEICFFSRLRTQIDVLENVFENIDGLFGGGLDKGGVTINVISNTFLNCASTSTLGLGGNGYPAGGEIAYNRAIHDKGTGTYYFLKYGSQYNGSWWNENTKIHHNTIVGYTAAFYSPLYQGKQNPYMWKPKIFDNIFVLPGGTNIIADAIQMWPNPNVDRNHDPSGSPFDVGTKFYGNAMLADAFGGGTMMTVNADSDIFANVDGLDETIELTAAPQFMNTTDPGDPDYYRVKSTDCPWAVKGGWKDAGDYPRYIGAVEPFYVAPGTFIIFK